MSFEAKHQENCKIAFKSLNALRSGHATDEDKIYEKSTDCYVKIPEDPSHKHVADYFEILDSSCAQETPDGDVADIDGYRMTDFFAEINSNENCMAGCVIQFQCLAAEWYPLYQECYYYIEDPPVKIVARDEPFLDGACYVLL